MLARTRCRGVPPASLRALLRLAGAGAGAHAPSASARAAAPSSGREKIWDRRGRPKEDPPLGMLGSRPRLPSDPIIISELAPLPTAACARQHSNLPAWPVQDYQADNSIHQS